MPALVPAIVPAIPTQPSRLAREDMLAQGANTVTELLFSSVSTIVPRCLQICGISLTLVKYKHITDRGRQAIELCGSIKIDRNELKC